MAAQFRSAPAIGRFLPIIAFTILLLAHHTARAQRVEVDTRLVATDLDTPWEITWGPDGWLWVTERPGHVSRIDPETGVRRLLLTVPAFDHQESGLYGLALHPNFADSPYVFINYSYRTRDSVEWYSHRVARYRYDSGRDTLIDEMILIDSLPSGYFHNGGRMLMLPDRTLLLAYGDQGAAALAAQLHDSLQGKLLRMDLNGNAPPDNPFFSYRYPLNLIYTTGHRNPQGLARLPDGRIYAAEHGTHHGDEINLIEPGGNYGWPHAEAFCDNYPYPGERGFCADSNVIEPKHAFYHGWDMTVAPGGLSYYDGPFEAWKGSLLVATMKNGLMQLRIDSASGDVVEIHRYFATAFDHRDFGRFRDLCISPDGRIFIGTSNQDGRAPSGFPVEGDDRILEVLPRTASGRYINAQPIGTRKGCAGEHFDVEIEIGGTFGGGNAFVLELSDPAGEFNGGEREVDTLRDPPDRLLYAVPIADEIAPGAKYRVRILSTDPPLVSEASIETIEVLPAPARPAIVRVGDELVAPDANRYQWFRGDTTAIDGAVESHFTPVEEGAYLVAVYNIAGCMALSEPYEYLKSSVPAASIAQGIPIMMRDGEVIVGPVPLGVSILETGIILSDLAGRTVHSMKHDLDGRYATVSLMGFPSGTYVLRVVAGSGVATKIIAVVR